MALPAFECGETIELQHERTGYALVLIVETVQRGLMLARPTAPYHRLHSSAQQASHKLSWKQTVGNAAAAWDIVMAGEAAGSVLVRGVCRKASSPVYLNVDADGALVVSEEEGTAAWQLRRGSSSDSGGGGVFGVVGVSIGSSSSSGGGGGGGGLGLGLSQGPAAAASFARDGFVVLPGLCAADKVACALRLLNHHLGSADLKADVEPDGIGMEYERAVGELDGSDGGEAASRGVVKLGSGRRCTCCLAQAAPLLALLGPAQRAAIGEAVGEQVAVPCGCQVALRFPLRPFGEGVLDGEAALPSLLPHAQTEWHSDAAKYNEKKSIDVVVGVFLNAMGTAAQGNLWVQPGSHLREREAREQQPGLRRLHSGHAYSHETATPITAAAAGSVVVFDKDLVHAGGPNLSPDIRYALYYRLRFEARAASAA